MHFQRYISSGLQAALALTLLICSASYEAMAAAGDADPIFGGGVGYRTYAGRYDAPWMVTGLLALPDGSAILAGHAETNVYVRHYLADGTLDAAFGDSGTATIRDLPFVLRNSTEFDPRLQVLQAPGGAILVEQSGAVRRLDPDGRLDSTLDAQLNVTGGFAQPTILPQTDGRIAVVTGQQGTSDPKQISVRFYLPDGTKDTVRGDVNGERLVYPAEEGVYIVYDAVTQPDGKILIAATLRRPSLSLDLVLVRILPNGALDSTFGQGGQAIVASQIGINTEPHVALGADGRIAYTFFVNDSPDYYVVYVLRADGAIDSTAPSGGRISVVMPNATVNLGELSINFSADNLSLRAVGNLGQPAQSAAMRWAIDTGPGAATSIPLPTFSDLNLDAGLGIFAVAFGGNTLWVAGGEDRVTFGLLGFHSLDTYQRGVTSAIDLSRPGSTPVSITATFLATPYTEAFDYLQLQPDGGPLLLGRASKYLTWSTLSKLTVDGDPVGQVRSQFDGTASAEAHVLLRSKVGDGTSTVLSTAQGCSITLQCGLMATLVRRNSAGMLVDTFGLGGSVSLPLDQLAGSIGAYTPGEVGAGSEASVLSALTQDNATIRLQPLVFDSGGRPKIGFSAAVQLVPLSPSISLWQSRLNQLPDGRWQAIAPSNYNQKVTLGVARWLPDGSVDPSLVTPLLIEVPTIGDDPYVLDMDSIVLGDGSTLVAVWELSQRIVLRLLPNGQLDPAFGAGGSIRIDGLLFAPFPASPATNPLRIRLALQPDRKILLAYSVKLASGTALAVARFTSEGHPDTTFTADGRFDSVFSLSGNEQASDIAVLPDGRIIVAGSSNGRALLLRLKGEATIPATPQFVVEFYNSILDHYFITAASAEAAAIEMGSAGPGWERTGYSFKSGGATSVCRFYGNANLDVATGSIFGPNSHFYTADPGECAELKALYTPTAKSWKFEGNDFSTTTPLFAAAGATTCPAGTIPVYRAYNNGFAQGIDSNHRFTSSLSAYTDMLFAGWIGEGIAMCAPQ